MHCYPQVLNVSDHTEQPSGAHPACLLCKLICEDPCRAAMRQGLQPPANQRGLGQTHPLHAVQGVSAEAFAADLVVQQRLAKKLKLKSTESVAGPEDGLDHLFKGEPRPLVSGMMQTLGEWSLLSFWSAQQNWCEASCC